jgi:hypothetical protein
MAEPGCVKCKMRRRYERKPHSLLGRLWKWHTGWCPGWKKYLKSLSDEERAAVIERMEKLAK